ncbi:hypothetical protein GCM10023115_32820 [Pontixanthobacter gangjinensis]|uniref:Lipid-binding SYLF domain-containing protein n=1 Tax=Christiangramia aestuarii TaxID=1028746 RepID=A0A7K1LT99_9FLAO|nr:hypothetical protein [Christiangramia aestuarii]MUP43700.1 hypothetical protein [Christiangramia aestuarii]
MKNLLKKSVLFMLLISLASAASYAQSGKDFIKDQDKEKLVIDAKYAIEKLKESNQDVVSIADDSYGYVIFPNVGKGAFIAGGAAGNGVVYQDGEQIGWAKLRQVDVGLQIGGEAFIEAIFFQTQQDLEEFKSGELEFTGAVSAVAITEGGSKSVNFEEGMAVVTMPKGGAMLEISVGGQKFSYQDK